MKRTTTGLSKESHLQNYRILMGGFMWAIGNMASDFGRNLPIGIVTMGVITNAWTPSLPLVVAISIDTIFGNGLPQVQVCWRK
jgi:hypothetical protein